MLNVIYAELRRRRFMKKVFIGLAIALAAIGGVIGFIIYNNCEEY